MALLEEYADQSLGLRLDLELILELGRTGRRADYLPICRVEGRLLLAFPEGRPPAPPDVERLRHDWVRGQRVELFTGVDYLEVPQDLYDKALWAYFGDLRPQPPSRPSPPVASQTFQLAEVAPADQALVTTTLWEYCRDRFTEVLGVSDFFTQVLDFFEAPKACENHLINAVYLAFAQHRPLILSPDMIWVTLLQGLAHHFELNAEELRAQMVEHEGKRRLTVAAPHFVFESLENPWEETFADFATAIRQHLRPQMADFARLRFSTTGAVEEAAFAVALMDILKVYFEYSLACVCGIPSLTLEGCPQDWQQMRLAIQPWREFGLGEWLDGLDPILGQFEAAASGRVDRIFWNDLYQRHDPWDGGYGGPLEKLTGWLARLFPYYGDKPNPAIQGTEEPLFATGFRSSLARASVLVQCADGEKAVEYVAGLLGVEQRGLALRPRMGWVVHQQQPDFIEDERERTLSRFRPEVRKRIQGS